MYWLIFSFLTALCEAAKDGLCKRSVKDLDYLYVAWAWKFFSLFFLIPYIFLSTFSINLNFFIALISGGILNILATLLYIKAIKVGDLSTTLPMLSFTPLFLLFTSPILVGDVPDLSGFVGVFLIFLGSFVLSRTMQMEKDGLKSSLKGPLYMLAVAFVWSIAANMDKIGIKNSSLFLWAISIQSFITFGLTVILLKEKNLKEVIWVSKKNLFSFFLIGFFTALGLSCQFLAISYGLVPYVISIKRLSIVFGVLVGGVFFKEHYLKLRLLASLIMFGGIICIAI